MFNCCCLLLYHQLDSYSGFVDPVHTNITKIVNGSSVSQLTDLGFALEREIEVF